MCINNAGPCYYQLCYPNGQSSTSKVFKCARGLIFDEKFQKCVWSLPWHACQSDIETTTSSFSTVSIKQEIINELKFRPGEKQLVTLFAKDLPEKIREFRSSNDSFDLTNSDQSEYAYIVVPIKLNRNQKMSVPKIKLKKKNRKNKNKRPMVNLDQLYKYKKICYVTNWSQYRPGAARFLPENVDPFLCTHIIFAFAYIDKNTLTIRTIEENDEEMYKRINDLKFKNPKLKTMLAIGGWKYLCLFFF